MSKCADCGKEVLRQWICRECSSNYWAFGGVTAFMNRLCKESIKQGRPEIPFDVEMKFRLGL